MLTERQLEIMENGASQEVEMLCGEVRRYREGIEAIVRRAADKDLRTVMMELNRLTQGDGVFGAS